MPCPRVHGYFGKRSFFCGVECFANMQMVFEVTENGAFEKLFPGWRFSGSSFLCLQVDKEYKDFVLDYKGVSLYFPF